MTLQPSTLDALAAGRARSGVRRGARAPRRAGRGPRRRASTSPASRRSRPSSARPWTSSPAATGVVAGLAVAAAVFDAVVRRRRRRSTCRAARTATRVARGDVLLTVTGRTRDLLTAERTALNLLCHLSGVATATAALGRRARRHAARRCATPARPRPGLRVLEKYAVRCGGGVNHRMSLSDAALMKDNHVRGGGRRRRRRSSRCARCSRGCRWRSRSTRSVSSTEVLDAGADLVLLDNFVPDQMRLAVGIADEHAAHSGRPRALLEASGGLTLADAAAGRGHRRRLRRRSGRSPTPRRCSTSAPTSDPLVRHSDLGPD